MKWVSMCFNKLMEELYSFFYFTAGEYNGSLQPPVYGISACIGFIIWLPLSHLYWNGICCLFKSETILYKVLDYIPVGAILFLFLLLVRYYLPKCRKIEGRIKNKNKIVKIIYGLIGWGLLIGSIVFSGEI